MGCQKYYFVGFANNALAYYQCPKWGMMMNNENRVKHNSVSDNVIGYSVTVMKSS
ncbi:hypothetical protein [Shewanella sp. UCD-KL21]|uniref:hypothetical protein n=1 Tax=Shewanella sp. UCD-KL21 TaxID=1917164 RepID=UPI001589BFAA|nr:hypothetical protein [Shewanella sp. UCD-KL21]